MTHTTEKCPEESGMLLWGFFIRHWSTILSRAVQFPCHTVMELVNTFHSAPVENAEDFGWNVIVRPGEIVADVGSKEFKGFHPTPPVLCPPFARMNDHLLGFVCVQGQNYFLTPGQESYHHFTVICFLPPGNPHYDCDVMSKSNDADGVLRDHTVIGKEVVKQWTQHTA